MKSLWPGIVSASLMAASVGVFIAGGHFAANALIDANRSKQLREFNDLALRRSEIAVNYGLASLNELARRGPMSCEASALQAVRLHVYQRGAVKDIRLLNKDGFVLCSAYSETLEFDKGWASRTEMLKTRDGSLRLFRVEQFSGVALGLLKDVDDNTSLAAILGINDNLLDIMPAKLRDGSAVALELSDGQIIARSSPFQQHELQPDTISVATSSESYPLRTVIQVDAKAFNQWDREPYLPIMALASVLGLVFGILLGRACLRPKSPVAELDEALAAREFRPYLQPIFNLRSGAIVGCEALARWVRADRTVIPPSRFIQLAESSGRIEAMTWQIVSTALHELQPRLRQDKNFKISFNIVPHHIVARGFVEQLRKITAEAKVSSRQIVLELTEREELEDLARAASVIAELREYGFKVAIDDVGIGHSGLSQIQKLGASTLKIDKFFVDFIGRDSTAKAVVVMLVRLAGELQMNVVAEGIETEEQVSALIACGVEEGQGFVVSPPLPVTDFVDFLDRRRADAAAVQEMEKVPARLAARLTGSLR